MKTETIKAQHVAELINGFKATNKTFETQDFLAWANDVKLPYRASIIKVLCEEAILHKIQHGRYEWTSTEPVHIKRVERVLSIIRERINGKKTQREYDILVLKKRLEDKGFTVLDPEKKATEHQLITAMKALGYRIFQEI